MTLFSGDTVTAPTYKSAMSNLLGKANFPAPCLACRFHRQSAFRLTRPAYTHRRGHKISRTRAADDNHEAKESADKDSHKSKKKKPNSLKDLNPVKLGKRSRAAINELLAVAEKADKGRSSSTSDKEDSGIDVNPIKLGRKSRAVLDDLWKQFAAIASPTRTARLTERYRGTGEGMSEFETPQAAFTTVLVIGATGRVGKVLVRKLLLRGYKVRALVRPRPSENGTGEPQRPAGVPDSVEVIYGDVSDFTSCLAAVEGVDKVK